MDAVQIGGMIGESVWTIFLVVIGFLAGRKLAKKHFQKKKKIE